MSQTNHGNFTKFYVGDLSGPGAARSLLKKHSNLASSNRSTNIHLDFTETSRVYPNGAVPFTCALEYLREIGTVFTAEGLNTQHSLPHVLNPVTSDEESIHDSQLTNVVWKYRDEAEAAQITKRFMQTLLDRMPCEEGVYDTLNWCLYEVLDNVFQHSQAPVGFVMMQLHKTTRKCAITVSDYGIGIHRAMAIGAGSGKIQLENIRKAHQAIELSVQQGITSKGKHNQGNGLFGLSRSVEINGGALTIHSGKGTLEIVEGRTTVSESDGERPLMDLENHHGTTVDWQLNCENPVSIVDALGSKFSRNDLLESIETVEGYHELDALELEASIGSRKQGREVRTRIMNYLRAGAPQIVLNMSRLDTVSSSFADEVLGRLAVELGDSEYKKRIAVLGASQTNRQIIARAVQLRVESESNDS